MVVTELFQIGIDFFKTCELPIIGFGSISLWELLWGTVIVTLVFYLYDCFVGD